VTLRLEEEHEKKLNPYQLGSLKVQSLNEAGESYIFISNEFCINAGYKSDDKGKPLIIVKIIKEDGEALFQNIGRGKTLKSIKRND